jgi:tetratricopeptide (TPR) repeat protein
LSEREHVIRGEIAAEACAPEPYKKGARFTRGIELDIEPEILLDVPVQAQSIKRLSQREIARYRRARFLLSSGEGLRSLLVANIPLAGLGLYEALLAQSWSIRFDNPEEMVRLAEAAAEIAQGLDPRGYGSKRVADLQARAWGELANAYRVVDRLRSAQHTFGQAYSSLQHGTGDPYLKARLFDLEASLLGKWREFSLALCRLASLSNIYRDLGEPHLAGRALIIRALYTYYDGGIEQSLALNLEGIDLIDRQRDPALFMLALHNQLLFLADLRLYPKANRLLFDSRQTLIYKDRINALRLRGVEGRINYGLGQLLSAELAFREVKKGSDQAGMSFYYALVSLELAMVLRSQGRIDEALQEIVEAREIFLSLEIYREYLGSIVFLEESFRRHEETPELIEATISHLRRKWLQMGSHQMR